MEAHKIKVKTGFDLMELNFFYRQLVLVCFFSHACGLFNSPTARLIKLSDKCMLLVFSTVLHNVHILG
jgi:hypothetical protein